jgi:hypothetical protein
MQDVVLVEWSFHQGVSDNKEAGYLVSTEMLVASLECVAFQCSGGINAV